jgi:uncharacterized protein (DUF427 family)
MKVPGPDHPITITPTSGRVTVRLGDRVIADSTSALSLAEAGYPVVQYVPLTDVDPDVLRSTDTVTTCPYKGDASYYSIVTDGDELTDAVWTYRTPHAAVAPIADHVAFYPDRVQVTVDE